MKRQNSICRCGHWDNKHMECIDNDCEIEHWHIACRVKGCLCPDFEPDGEMMECLRQEAEERKYQEWKDRT